MLAAPWHSVLGVVCAVDNNKGGVGIAPNVTAGVVSSYPDNEADAILAASQALPPEACCSSSLRRSESAITMLYRSKSVKRVEMIHNATPAASSVVECAANGTANLDDFKMTMVNTY